MSLRLTLEEKATNAMSEMMNELKQDYPEISLTSSSLASWVLIYFFKKHFKKSKPELSNHHFNPKAYIRMQLKGLDSAEKVEAALSEIRNKIKNMKGHRKTDS